MANSEKISEGLLLNSDYQRTTSFNGSSRYFKDVFEDEQEIYTIFCNHDKYEHMGELKETWSFSANLFYKPKMVVNISTVQWFNNGSTELTNLDEVEKMFYKTYLFYLNN